jgi:hypothetical protein
MTLPILTFRRMGSTGWSLAWQPTPEELVALMAGASVLLSVVGTGHPSCVGSGVAPVETPERRRRANELPAGQVRS